MKIVSISRSLIPQAVTPEEFITYCAKVSNPDNQTNNLSSSKLIGYLIKNKHWSPFEMVSVTMEIKTTRDIARQMLRHRSFSFQEFSQRYAVANSQFVTRGARLQDLKNRQNSIPTEDDDLQEVWADIQKAVQVEAASAYRWALDNGIAKEQARVVLPEGMTESTLYMAGTLRSWIHYVQLREANGTQLEHQLIAKEAKELLRAEFPNIIEAVDEPL